MWYRFSQNKNILFHRKDSNITANNKFNFKRYSQSHDSLKKMREYNIQTPEELSIPKQTYTELASGLNPQENKEELDKAWSEYKEELQKLPNFPESSFPSFEEWRELNPEERLKEIWEGHLAKDRSNIEKEYEKYKQKLQQESEKNNTPYIEPTFEEFYQNKLSEKSRQIHRAESDLRHLEQEYGLTSEETNPLLAINDIKKQWALKVADHYAQELPYSENGDTVTLLIGYPGAGKNSYLKNKDLGVLIDPDVFQEDLIGYKGGLGSESTMVYANSVVKPYVIEEAIRRKNNIVIPLVGGTSDAILNEATRFLVQGYKVHVVLVPTEASISHQRSINRANLGGRLIAPYTTEGNPIQAYDQAQNDLRGEKFIKKILPKIGLTPAQFNKNPEAQEVVKDLANKITFEVAEI